MTDNVLNNTIVNKPIPNIDNDYSSNQNATTTTNVTNSQTIPNSNEEISNNIANSGQNNQTNPPAQLSDKQKTEINNIDLNKIPLKEGEVSKYANSQLNKLFSTYFTLSQEYKQAKNTDVNSNGTSEPKRPIDQILDSMDSVKNLIKQELQSTAYNNNVKETVLLAMQDINSNIPELKDGTSSNLTYLNSNLEKIIQDSSVSKQEKLELMQDVLNGLKKDTFNSEQDYFNARNRFSGSVKKFISSSIKEEKFFGNLNLGESNKKESIESKATDILSSRIINSDKFDPKTTKVLMGDLFNEFKTKNPNVVKQHGNNIDALKTEFANRIDELDESAPKNSPKSNSNVQNNANQKVDNTNNTQVTQPTVTITKDQNIKQSNDSHTCFLLSVVNGLSHFDKGMEVLNKIIQNDGIVLPGSNQNAKIKYKPQTKDSYSPLEEALIEAYKNSGFQYDRAKGGDAFDVATEMFGLAFKDSIGGAEKQATTIDAAWEKIKENLKDDTFCIMHTGESASGHFMSIVGYREDGEKKLVTVKNSSSDKIEEKEFDDNFFYSNYVLQFFSIPNTTKVENNN